VAQTNYSKSFGKESRNQKTLERGEYLSRSREFARKGEELKHSKLTAEAVDEIKSAVVQRDKLREYIKRNLSNHALAEKHGVHYRTIEKIVQFETWTHIK
jgi:DNA-binding transcriptional regulator YhcF (GntR family)